MRRLSLTEFRTESAVALSVPERDAVRRLHPGIRLEPTLGREDRYDVTSDEHVGVISLPTLVVEIRPKVPMSSVLFMVSYSCDALSWFEQQPGFSRDVDLVEILAIMLGRLVERATRRGLLNGYQNEEEALQAPRGRILFDEHVRRRLGIAPPIDVRHDVFTSDILENRLLLAALNSLRRLPLRSESGKREIARALRLLGAVRDVHFPTAAVPDVLFTRLNRHYQPPVTLATLILRSASLELGTGAMRGSAFLVDMNDAFERFVRSALRNALGVSHRAFPDRPPRTRLDEAGLVPLKPDLCLVAGDGRIRWVGDAKYKRLPSGSYRNADLYQLLAYSVALDLPGGTLIYAADEGVTEAEHVTKKAGKRLRVVSLDLGAPPRDILRQVGIIADGIRQSGHRDASALQVLMPVQDRDDPGAILHA